MAHEKDKNSPLTYREHWSREGFYGDGVVVTRSVHTADYTSVTGPHAPHRLNVKSLALPDRHDPAALPLPVLRASTGVQLSVSARVAAMPHLISNVEADELHFVQDGEMRYHTAFGAITGLPGDFVCIPRAVPYTVEPKNGMSLSIIIESPGALKIDPRPDFQVQVERASPIERSLEPPKKVLLVKSHDEITRYEKPHDLFSYSSIGGGNVPVWKVNLRALFNNESGPPAQFLSAPNSDVLCYNLCARPSRRPPIHTNADYDEVIFYSSGPGAWGRVDEPGTLTWVPKGISHHGPVENVPEGFQAWLLES
ncbi:MAG: homogentisate 1,2-dioxygenase, partial [Deltaproteobacteria bacterium]|nr:homogentisate 1,2-dioxygenase [Deltaproteobacteria bacterium]